VLCKVFPLLVFKLEELECRVKDCCNSAVRNRQFNNNLLLVGSKLLNAKGNAVFKVTIVRLKLKVISY
jgi:hypothetical protein